MIQDALSVVPVLVWGKSCQSCCPVCQSSQSCFPVWGKSCQSCCPVCQSSQSCFLFGASRVSHAVLFASQVSHAFLFGASYVSHAVLFVSQVSHAFLIGASRVNHAVLFASQVSHASCLGQVVSVMLSCLRQVVSCFLYAYDSINLLLYEVPVACIPSWLSLVLALGLECLLPACLIHSYIITPLCMLYDSGHGLG